MSITPEAALVALEPWIAKHRRTGWRPQVCVEDHADAISTFSGIPSLRLDEDWPRCQSCRVPMELLLQLDLANLPTQRHGTELLQLFYCVATDSCDRGWEAFANHSSLCRSVRREVVQPATSNLNRFPRKTISGWTPISDVPDPAEHERLGLRFDYHFGEVPFRPMEFWCDELRLHLVGSAYINHLQHHVVAAEQDKLGGWPRWVQGVEYPVCPQCGAEMELVMQLDSEDHIPFMFGDCGIGHITQCPIHHHIVAFGWACS